MFYFKSADASTTPAGILRIDDATLKFAENPTKQDLGNQWLLCIEVPYANTDDKKHTGICSFYISGLDEDLESWKNEIRKAIGWWTRKSSVGDYDNRKETCT